MSDAVDLLTAGAPARGGWALGENYIHEPHPNGVATLLRQLSSTAKGEWLLLWDPDLGAPSAAVVRDLTRANLDVAHAGLMLGMGGKPRLFDTVRPLWPHNCDPDVSIPAVSWRVSFRACLLRRAILEEMGGPRPEFQTLDAAALEWGHRLLRHGGWVFHRPELLVTSPESTAPAPRLPVEDELRFILYRFGRRWLKWAVLRATVAGYVSRRHLLAAYHALAGVSRPAPPAAAAAGVFGGRSSLGRADASRVTVLLPTVDRYPSLRTLLSQLGEQTHPPFQVVIVDQTPEERRRLDLAGDYPGLPIEVVTLDRAGQCSARNAGLALAAGDAVLFLDDDDEIEPDLIERHVLRMAETGVDASCGVADEVGAGPLPEDFEIHRLSDVFPTNNTLLRLEALHRSGLFDLAYDRGPRADGDLGMRLYLSGAVALLSPDIRVLHNHVPRGGLRTHGARAVTYASSRSRVFVRNLPEVTELYLGRRYFSKRQRREVAWIRLAGTFSIRGGRALRLAKAVVAAVQLPTTVWALSRCDRVARRMFEEGGFPKIPWPAEAGAESTPEEIDPCAS